MKLQQGSRSRSLGHCRELQSGDESSRLSSGFSKTIFHQIPHLKLTLERELPGSFTALHIEKKSSKTQDFPRYPQTFWLGQQTKPILYVLFREPPPAPATAEPLIIRTTARLKRATGRRATVLLVPSDHTRPQHKALRRSCSIPC